MMSESSDAATEREWDRSARVHIEDGIVYVEADAVQRWLERADRELASRWSVTVDRIVRTGMERSTEPAALGDDEAVRVIDEHEVVEHETDAQFLARLRRLGEDWRYSDEFIGIVVRCRFRRVRLGGEHG